MEGQMQAINELLVTPEFLDEIRKAGSDEDVQKIFGVHGIRLSLEEVAQMLDASEQVYGQGEGELSERALEHVSGGRSFGAILNICLPITYPRRRRW